MRYFHHKLQLNGAMDGYSYDNDSEEEKTNYRPAHNTRPSSSSVGRGGGYDNQYSEYNDDDCYTLERHSDPNTLPDCRFSEEQIRLLIAKRLECKKRRNFADADKILEALNTNGIFLQDKARKYRVDGANHFGRKPPYVRRGSTYGTSVEDLTKIAKLVEERVRHKLKREYHASDGITDTLKNRYGVRVNDKKREWSVVLDGNNSNDNGKGNGLVSSHKNSGPGLAVSENLNSKSNNNNNQEHYIPTPLAPDDHATHTMSDQLKYLIRDKLRDRSTARKNKKYKEADRIRDELVEEYSILIDDKNKEWKVVDYDADDDLDEYDPFVNEARLSQRSAFVQKGAGGQGKGGENENMHAHNYNDNYHYVDNDNNNNNNGDEDLADASSSSSSSRTVLDREDKKGKGNTNTATDDEIAAAGESDPSDRRPLLAALTVPLLKDKLRAEGLRLGGNKAELIDRLLAAGIIE